MIVQEIVQNLRRTYSDEQWMIKLLETGNIYDEAYDNLDSDFHYEETNEKILPPPV